MIARMSRLPTIREFAQSEFWSAGALACVCMDVRSRGTSTPPRETRVGDPGGCAPLLLS